MTAKHRSPEYQRNARIIRSRVRTLHRLGEPVPCWRCRGPIVPGQPFDVGHVHPHGGEGLDNLAPEHRHATAACQGNRAAGGADGARITNSRRPVPAGEVTRWPL